MNSYFVNYPRNFSNEYEVYAVARGSEARLLALLPDASPISRKEAIRLGITRVAEAKRDNEQWFGGLCEYDAARNLPWNATTAQKLEACAVDTLAWIEQQEMEREAAAEYMADLRSQA